ncbi:Lipopolysaccharide assembly protein B [Gammaproteobacteria bacterium]
MWELLLLPVAAASGWMAARRHFNKRSVHTRRGWSSGYFQGLNYLLNEEPDKAIEVFTQIVQIDGETVEIQLALGNLFRRRGEVSRAIRLHQDIFARPDLNREQRTQALLELGQDYMRAGLFDRAESLFLELIDMDAHRVPALHYLVDIYQQEKDWEKAIAILQRLGTSTGRSVQPGIAHYFCELAEIDADKEDYPRARMLLGRALDTDPNCVRASLLENQIAARIGDYQTAIAALHRVEHQDPDFIGEIIGPLSAGYHALGMHKELDDYLQGLLGRYHNTSLIIVNAELIRTRSGDLPAIEFLTTALRQHPSVRGTKRLLTLDITHYQGMVGAHFAVINDLVGQLFADWPLYCCRHCGFTGKSLHWQCPSCKSWSTVRPIQGVEEIK